MRKVLFIILLCLVFSFGCVTFSVDEGGTKPVESTTSFESEVIQFDVEYEYCRYNAIVRIENTGDTPISLGYTAFDVEDATGHLIATENSSAIYAQPQVVNPGECGYYFAARLELPDTIAQDEDYKLIYQTDYIRAVETEPTDDLLTVDVSFPDGDYSKVIGRIDNASRLGTADVVCVCYDEQHQIVTIGGTIVDLSGSGKTTFEIWNMAAYGKDNIVEYDIIARMR